MVKLKGKLAVQLKLVEEKAEPKLDLLHNHPEVATSGGRNPVLNPKELKKSQTQNNISK